MIATKKQIHESALMFWAERRLLKALEFDGSICHSCAGKYGGEWPDGHRASMWSGQCCVCLKETSCCAVSDWNWPDKDVHLDREF